MVRKNAAILFGVGMALSACADSATDGSITAPTSPRSRHVELRQGATGARASGHYELASPIFNILEEQYSFVAVSTGDFPNAKGQMQATITRATTFQKIHIEVDCLVIIGNTAWIGGPITKITVNGVSQAPAGRYDVWQVQDNGEGADSPPDLGSVLFLVSPPSCLEIAGQNLPMTPTANGNIQVSAN